MIEPGDDGHTGDLVVVLDDREDSFLETLENERWRERHGNRRVDDVPHLDLVSADGKNLLQTFHHEHVAVVVARQVGVGDYKVDDVALEWSLEAEGGWKGDSKPSARLVDDAGGEAQDVVGRVACHVGTVVDDAHGSRCGREDVVRRSEGDGVEGGVGVDDQVDA